MFKIYNKIYNIKKHKWVSINSTQGKIILQKYVKNINKNYLHKQKGGAAASDMRLPVRGGGGGGGGGDDSSGDDGRDKDSLIPYDSLPDLDKSCNYDNIQLENLVQEFDEERMGWGIYKELPSSHRHLNRLIFNDRNEVNCVGAEEGDGCWFWNDDDKDPREMDDETRLMKMQIIPGKLYNYVVEIKPGPPNIYIMTGGGYYSHHSLILGISTPIMCAGEILFNDDLKISFINRVSGHFMPSLIVFNCFIDRLRYYYSNYLADSIVIDRRTISQ